MDQEPGNLIGQIEIIQQSCSRNSNDLCIVVRRLQLPHQECMARRQHWHAEHIAGEAGAYGN